MKKHRSKKAWIDRHLHDPYVQQATQEGYRSRAAYKLLEIDEKDHLFRPGMRVVDLGAAPGAWSQVAAAKVGANGSVFALDCLPMKPLPGVTVIHGDFTEAATLELLLEALQGEPVNVVLSDMAPNLSGIAITDAAKSFALAELALDFARTHLTADGAFLVKVFQGPGIDDYRQQLQSAFHQVLPRKPKASRAESSELYYLAKRPKR
ncbi:RlmE family RNA methyltransferase [Hydrogenophilus islandicus]